MKKLLALFFLGISLCTTSVSGDFYDITTVYKFNTEEFDHNGELNTRYLNTCTVSVHPQSNAIGLPYINVDRSQPFEVKYPVEKPTIPYLDVNANYSLWKIPCGVEESEQEYFLRSKLEYDYSYEFYRMRDIFDNIFEHEVAICDPQIVICSEQLTTVMVSSSCMSSVYRETVNGRVWLGVNFQLNELKKITLAIEDGNLVDINIYDVDKSIEAQYISTNGENNADLIKFHVTNSSHEIHLYINLGGALTIYNAGDRKAYISKRIIPNYNYNHILLTTEECPSGFETGISYEFIQLKQNVLSDNNSIDSPWLSLKNESFFFIIYYRKFDDFLGITLIDQGGQESLNLISEELRVLQLNGENSDRLVDEIVLSKVMVTFPNSWTLHKRINISFNKDMYIRDLWEGTDSDIYRIHQSKACVKSDITEIYNVALRDPYMEKQVTFCSNGGFLDSSNTSCICPPGFTGDFCEIACGRNCYGKKCSKLCSNTNNDCKGMILCTPSYGCSCAPGYHGDQCLQQCEKGTYGADCKQMCGNCKGGCDKYTGYCREKCDSPFLIWPSCKYFHSYWKGHPEIVNSTFNTVELSLNFQPENIFNSYDRINFFIIQYKEDADITWRNSSYRTYKQQKAKHTVNNLKPGRKYLFRVIFLDETLESNEPKLSKVSEGLTKCSVSVKNNNLQIIKSSNTTIEIKLSPNQTYLIKLKKLTVHGESVVLSRTTATTDALTIDYSMQVVGLTVRKSVGSEVQLEWFQHPLYKIYYIKII